MTPVAWTGVGGPSGEQKRSSRDHQETHGEGEERRAEDRTLRKISV